MVLICLSWFGLGLDEVQWRESSCYSIYYLTVFLTIDHFMCWHDSAPVHKVNSIIFFHICVEDHKPLTSTLSKTFKTKLSTDSKPHVIIQHQWIMPMVLESSTIINGCDVGVSHTFFLSSVPAQHPWELHPDWRILQLTFCVQCQCSVSLWQIVCS